MKAYSRMTPNAPSAVVQVFPTAAKYELTAQTTKSPSTVTAANWAMARISPNTTTPAEVKMSDRLADDPCQTAIESIDQAFEVLRDIEEVLITDLVPDVTAERKMRAANHPSGRRSVLAARAIEDGEEWGYYVASEAYQGPLKGPQRLLKKGLVRWSPVSQIRETGGSIEITILHPLA